MKITLCMVAYSQKFNETRAFHSLTKLSEKILENLDIIIFDNGKVDYSQAKVDFFKHFNYIYNESEERGTRIAYQKSLELSKNEWILLLDDDTKLTEDYLQSVFDKIRNNKEKQVVAYCPMIFDQAVQISPTASDTLAMLNYPKKAGQYSDITGISSGLIISSEFLQQIGGFNEEFPLDYLDHWLFYKIAKEKKLVEVINSSISHQLSVQNLQSISDERFYKIFRSEYLFYRKYKPELIWKIKKKYARMIVKGIFDKGSGIRWKYLVNILTNKI